MYIYIYRSNIIPYSNVIQWNINKIYSYLFICVNKTPNQSKIIQILYLHFLWISLNLLEWMHLQYIQIEKMYSPIHRPFLLAQTHPEVGSPPPNSVMLGPNPCPAHLQMETNGKTSVLGGRTVQTKSIQTHVTTTINSPTTCHHIPTISVPSSNKAPLGRCPLQYFCIPKNQKKLYKVFLGGTFFGEVFH